MGWFEKIGLEAPSNEELNKPEPLKAEELEKELQRERQELSEYLAYIYDEARELGTDLDASYEQAGNASYQTVKAELSAHRGKIAMMLDEVDKATTMLKDVEESLEGLAKRGRNDRKIDA